jgi:hypothetical protein
VKAFDADNEKFDSISRFFGSGRELIEAIASNRVFTARTFLLYRIWSDGSGKWAPREQFDLLRFDFVDRHRR